MKIVLSTLLLMTTGFVTAGFSADQKLGKPLAAASPISLAAVFANPDKFVNHTVQVEGKVTEVCQAMGCWMNLTDAGGHLLRIKVEDGDLVFPKDSVGKTAIAEGRLEKHELTREQTIAAAKHEAEDAGRSFDPSKIKEGKAEYQIAGSGAVILDR